jgi:hypothetical protein
MKAMYCLFTLALPLVFAGCGAPPAADTGKEEQKIKASLDKLSPEDRKLAEEQKFCALENDHRLGSMGTPHKAMVKGEPVFLCCKGCEKEILADPDKALAKVKELRAHATGRE